MSIGRVPRNRLQRIPKRWRLAHDYCFFLHDECVRALVEYEAARANLVTIQFKSRVSAEEFSKVAKEDPADALIKTGYPDEARRVVINAITMGMVSDCMHHIFEALKCFEKRKIVVGFNLLRKPLKQNLLYLAWMLGNEAEFYGEFMAGNPENLAQKKVGNRRRDLFAKAKENMAHGTPFDPDSIEKIIYDRKFEHGLELLFEHAVHLVTVERIELRTSPQNFNFIFKSYGDDDTYDWLYRWLPYLMFFLSQIVMELFDRMRPMESGVKMAFGVRSMFGYGLLSKDEASKTSLTSLKKMLAPVACEFCKTPLAVTAHNAARIVLTDSFRCTGCRKKNLIPFSWSF